MGADKRAAARPIASDEGAAARQAPAVLSVRTPGLPLCTAGARYTGRRQLQHNRAAVDNFAEAMQIALDPLARQCQRGHAWADAAVCSQALLQRSALGFLSRACKPAEIRAQRAVPWHRPRLHGAASLCRQRPSERE
jgi:hypothetical protein